MLKQFVVAEPMSRVFALGQRMSGVTAVTPSTATIKTRLLEGLTKVECEEVIRGASHRWFAADCVVTNQEDPADYLFLLTKGSARHFFMTPEGRKILLLWLRPGEIFGGIALSVVPSVYLAGTEVSRGSRVAVWHRSKIRELANRYPMLLDNTLAIASDYFRWFIAAHVALVCEGAQQRLAGVLASLASGIGRNVTGGIKLELTNEQLANAANVSVFTASRFISRWQRDKILRKTRGTIVLYSPERLRQQCS
jgi:CRP-like cAMP-binding protein